jgi:hypothetical protein
MRSIANDLRTLIPNEVQIGSVYRQTFSRLIEEVDHQISQLEAMSEPDNTQLDAFRLARTLLNRPEPPEGALRGGNLGLSCDGECEKSWSYADGFYACKSCPDVHFCKDYRDKLVAGKLPIFMCSSEHDWLHIPKWDDEE